jgi:hypothetical protein
MGVFEEAPRRVPDLRKLVGKTQKQIAKARADAEAFENAADLQVVLEGAFGSPTAIAAGSKRVAPPELVKQYSLLLNKKEEGGLLLLGLLPNLKGPARTENDCDRNQSFRPRESRRSRDAIANRAGQRLKSPRGPTWGRPKARDCWWSTVTY